MDDHDELIARFLDGEALDWNSGDGREVFDLVQRYVIGKAGKFWLQNGRDGTTDLVAFATERVVKNCTDPTRRPRARTTAAFLSWVKMVYRSAAADWSRDDMRGKGSRPSRKSPRAAVAEPEPTVLTMAKPVEVVDGTSDDDQDDDETALAGVLPLTPYHHRRQVERREILEAALAQLEAENERYAACIRLLLEGEATTGYELAAALGVTRDNADHIKSRAKARLTELVRRAVSDPPAPGRPRDQE